MEGSRPQPCDCLTASYQRRIQMMRRRKRVQPPTATNTGVAVSGTHLVGLLVKLMLRSTTNIRRCTMSVVWRGVWREAEDAQRILTPSRTLEGFGPAQLPRPYIWARVPHTTRFVLNRAIWMERNVLPCTADIDQVYPALWNALQECSP